MSQFFPVRPAAELRLVRLRGEHGPIIRCSGELRVNTAEALRRELQWWVPLGYPALVIDLTGCRDLDVDGLLALFEAHLMLAAAGERLMLVAAGGGRLFRLLQALQVEQIIPLFSCLEAAERFLGEGASSLQNAVVGQIGNAGGGAATQILTAIRQEEWAAARQEMVRLFPDGVTAWR